jgi:hypothetical protein
VGFWYGRKGDCPIMFTLRCTAKLLKRLRVEPAATRTPPSTRLDDWYANLLFTRPAHLVLCVSERTLLPVLIPARNIGALAPRLREGVADVLRALELPENAIQEEQEAMAPAILGKTASRQVLGSMNDFVTILEAYRDPTDSPPALLNLALWLAGTPCSPLRMNCPGDETIRLFVGERGTVAGRGTATES